MGHRLSYIGHTQEIGQVKNDKRNAYTDDFVLEKNIFNNVFKKDIRRVFIYKKAERIAKAIQLIAPAFAPSVSLRNRVDAVAVGLVDAAIAPPGVELSRELLAFSSLLSIARASGLLSEMNAELIMREVHALLQEVAAYEEPRIALEDAPTLSGMTKNASVAEGRSPEKKETKTYIKDKENIKDRRSDIMSVIEKKGLASIKDISVLMRGISEKTIQRELAALIEVGAIVKKGERRWSTYQLAG